MRKFKVKGTCEISYLVDVEKEAWAENEEEALEIVQEVISTDHHYGDRCRWMDRGLDVVEIE